MHSRAGTSLVIIGVSKLNDHEVACACRRIFSCPGGAVEVGPLDAGRVADLRPYLDLVPDRAWRGRWYSLTAVLLVCAWAAVSRARSLDELAEWTERAPDVLLAAVGIRRHLLRWRRAPSRTTIGRVLKAVDGDALDRPGSGRPSRRPP
ncbi:transposase family protein [Streptomyces sp. NPDC026665]|uniref:transposase family protein n=1 Tax=Streptomyces sp. NPDC026665 TaxID=3154798 RepID=UPI0033C67264